MKTHFRCGIIKRRRDGLYSYDVTNPTAIKENIIPFFRKYGFLSVTKRKNFSIFSKAVRLMDEKKHLTEEGFRELLLIREKLNVGAGRKRKYTIGNVLSESSETIR